MVRWTVAVLPVAFLVGTTLRRCHPAIFRGAFRGHLLVLATSVAFAAGATVEIRAVQAAALGLLLGGELLALWVGAALASRGRVHPVATSGSSNSGFWSIPVAGAVFGPSGAAFAAVYDALSAVRSVILVHILRRHAVVRPSGRTAIVDYAPQAAVAMALCLRAAGFRSDLRDALRVLGVLTGAGGFALLGMAMPYRWPGRRDWTTAAPCLPLRFGIPVCACAAASATGLALPPALWVVALAPHPLRSGELRRPVRLPAVHDRSNAAPYGPRCGGPAAVGAHARPVSPAPDASL